MNRHERHTTGKKIVERLRILKNSAIYKDADLSNLPEDVIKALSTGKCENKALQKHYNTCLRILDEIIRLEIELQRMNLDLKQKQDAAKVRHQEKLQKHQSDETPSPQE
jgi:hypothetical protein